MTTYEQLRAKINAIDPSRLVLGFGSRVICKDGMEGVYIGMSQAGNMLVLHEPSMKVWSKPYKGSVGLGAPLTLADVLRAIGVTKYAYVSTNQTIRVADSFGNEDVVFIDLSKPVSEWSDEVLNALIELIS